MVLREAAYVPVFMSKQDPDLQSSTTNVISDLNSHTKLRTKQYDT